MAYAETNPPVLVSQSVGGKKGQLWTYLSADVHTDVDAANYFTNGLDLGMKAGDVVFVVETDNSYALSIHVVTEVSSDGATVAGRITS